MKGSSNCNKSHPPMPEFYMPAMWPLGLQRSLRDWYRAWRQRSRYRQLLRLDDAELAKRDLSRQQLLERARLPLRQLVEGRRRKRGA